MTKPMPGALELFTSSWRLFTSTWNESLKASIWFLYVGLFNFALMVLIRFFPILLPLAIPAAIAVFFVVLWASLRLLQVMLQLEAGKKPDMSKTADRSAMDLLLPAVWISLLNVLIVLAGTVLFILPGIFLSVALSFSQMYLVADKIHGSQALQASRELVRGRWWQTFWRILSVAFVIGVVVGLVTVAFTAIVGAIAGPSLSLAHINQQEDPLAQGTMTLFQSVYQAALMPLMIGYQVKLFRALQRTR